jgi:hypothetical protein
MKKLSHLRTVIVPFLILFLASSALGQHKNQDVFAPVPAELRTQLIERFEQFFEYGRSGQWDSYYDLLYFKRASDARREYFIEQQRKSSPAGWSQWMVEIYPDSMRRNDGSILDLEWIIEGAVKVQEQREGKHSFRVGAIFREGKWFFSEPTFGAPPIICPPVLKPQ